MALTGNQQKINVGPCWALFGSTTSRNLGYTQGGLTIEPTVETSEITVDQRASAIDEQISSFAIDVTVPVVQWDADNLVLAFPGSEKVSEPAAKAEITTALGVTDAELTFTAADAGHEGNSIQVEYLEPTGDSATLAVSVAAKKITVTLGKTAGAVDSTASDVKTAIEGEAEATALIAPTLPGESAGSGLVTAMEALSLEGGTNLIDYVDIKDPSGISLASLAEQLTLHPVDRDDGDITEDIIYYKAFPRLNGAIAIDKENPKVINLTFTVFPDDEHAGKYGRVNTPGAV